MSGLQILPIGTKDVPIDADLRQLRFKLLTFLHALLASAERAAIRPRVPYPEWAGRLSARFSAERHWARG
jgi:hypothetical protein